MGLVTRVYVSGDIAPESFLRYMAQAISWAEGSETGDITTYTESAEPGVSLMHWEERPFAVIVQYDETGPLQESDETGEDYFTPKHDMTGRWCAAYGYRNPDSPKMTCVDLHVRALIHLFAAMPEDCHLLWRNDFTDEVSEITSESLQRFLDQWDGKEQQ